MTAPNATTLPDGRCLNCDAPLAGPFCSACGQRVPRSNPTVAEFLRESTHELTHWDGKIPRTLKALLSKPGLLTTEFLAGRRARWLPPLRIYIICSLAYFLVAPAVDRITGAEARQPARITVTGDASDSTRLGLTDQAREQLDKLGARALLGDERFDRIVDDLGALNRRITGSIADTMPRIMFALMPMFALLTWLAWRDGGSRYPEHLYFSLHLHAAWFAALVPAKLVELTGSVLLQVVTACVVIAYSTWYGIAAIKRVLGGTPAQLFVRSSIVGIVYGIWVLAILFVTMAYVILTY